MKKCQFCGAEMDDYQQRCSSCGILQNKEKIKPNNLTTEGTSKEEIDRKEINDVPIPKITVFWLGLMVVCNISLFVFLLYSLCVGNVILSLQSVVYALLCGLNILGPLLLLKRLKCGFYIIFVVYMINFVADLIEGEAKVTIILGLSILLIVLYKKSNGIRYWDTLH